jgi:hypothetical protein
MPSILSGLPNPPLKPIRIAALLSPTQIPTVGGAHSFPLFSLLSSLLLSYVVQAKKHKAATITALPADGKGIALVRATPSEDARPGLATHGCGAT